LTKKKETESGGGGREGNGLKHNKTEINE